MLITKIVFCFTGHRIIPANETADTQKHLESEMIHLIHQGVRYFGAVEFDIMAALMVLKLKNPLMSTWSKNSMIIFLYGRPILFCDHSLSNLESENSIHWVNILLNDMPVCSLNSVNFSKCSGLNLTVLLIDEILFSSFFIVNLSIIITSCNNHCTFMNIIL